MIEWNIEGIVDEIFEDYTKEQIESGEVAIEDYYISALRAIEEQIDWTISERLSAMEM
tara:strand:- start:328 stop:501 length:174 start_codon:yes stop_codon:yes gene_type:complete